MYHPADFKVQPEHDYALVEPIPGEPDIAETFNIWLYDGKKNIGVNLHPYATGGALDCAVTVFLPDGRIARANYGSAAKITGAAKPASQFVQLHCIEPLKLWEANVTSAPVYVTSDAEQAAGTVSDETPTEKISLHASFRTTAPAWINGALLPESRQTIDEVAFFFGVRLASGYSPQSYRYDQLIEGEGTIEFEGNVFDFHGVGLRGRVRGVRRMPGMNGHTWAEGYFPESRRGFGTTMFLRNGGGYLHSEAFIYQDDRMYPARIIHIPHIDRSAEPKPYVFELACDELGLVRIEGIDVRAFWWQMQGWGAHAPIKFGRDATAPVLMKQGIGRFSWDGDIGYGLVERSGG